MAKGLNGIDVEAMGGFLDMVKGNRDLGNVKFVASSTWQGGCHSEVSVSQFYVNGGAAAPEDRKYQFRIDEPPPLGGSDQAPNPAEMLAAALCGCLTAAISANAALFGTQIDSLDVKTEIDWDVAGLLGLDRSVPCAAKGIHYTVTLKGPNPEGLRKAKETIDRKSPILRTLAEAIPITTTVVIE